MTSASTPLPLRHVPTVTRAVLQPSDADKHDLFTIISVYLLNAMITFTAFVTIWRRMSHEDCTCQASFSDLSQAAGSRHVMERF